MDKMIKLRVKFNFGLDEKAKAKFKTLTLSNINESATKDTLLGVCAKIDDIVDGSREEAIKVTEEVLK